MVAVSGGPDSVALFHVLRQLADKYALGLSIAHVNHALRGTESEEEQQMVAKLAEYYNVPFYYAKVDVKRHMRETGKGLQDAARELRYRFLFETAERTGTSCIALAHHADDQAETVLMRMLRGTSTEGLAGIHPVRMQQKVKLVRPLLRIEKMELVQFCKEHGFEFAEDSSNASRAYTRNQIRLDIMPQLKQFNPEITSALNRLADIVRDDEQYLQREAERAYAETVSVTKDGLMLKQAQWSAFHASLQRRLIKLILNYLSLDKHIEVDYETVESIRLACSRHDKSNFRIQIREHCWLMKEYDRLRFTTSSPSEAESFSVKVWDWPVQISLDGREHLLIRFEVIGPGEYAEKDGSYSAFFDLDELSLPLYVRSRKPGDRMQVLGLNGSKKVKDMLIDAKIPPAQRGYIPIVTDAEGRILWIPGLRRSAHALVRPTTGRILHIHTPEFIQ